MILIWELRFATKSLEGGGVFTPRHVIIHELLCDQPLNVRHALYIVLKQLHILYLFPFSRVCVRVHCVFTPEKLVSQDFWGQGSSFRCSQKNIPSSAASGGICVRRSCFPLDPQGNQTSWCLTELFLLQSGRRIKIKRLIATLRV